MRVLVVDDEPFVAEGVERMKPTRQMVFKSKRQKQPRLC